MSENPSQLMYLPNEHWSPRYDLTFFTIKIEGYELKTAVEAPAATSISIGGKSNLPAYYYQINIYRQHERRSVWRRYSQFKWLYEQVTKFPPSNEPQPAHASPLELPPGTCFFASQNDAFAKNRTLQLTEFLNSMLDRPGYANHPAVLAFLEM